MDSTCHLSNQQLNLFRTNFTKLTDSCLNVNKNSFEDLKVIFDDTILSMQLLSNSLEKYLPIPEIPVLVVCKYFYGDINDPSNAKFRGTWSGGTIPNVEKVKTVQDILDQIRGPIIDHISSRSSNSKRLELARKRHKRLPRYRIVNISLNLDPLFDLTGQKPTLDPNLRLRIPKVLHEKLKIYLDIEEYRDPRSL